MPGCPWRSPRADANRPTVWDGVRRTGCPSSSRCRVRCRVVHPFVPLWHLAQHGRCQLDVQPASILPPVPAATFHTFPKLLKTRQNRGFCPSRHWGNSSGKGNCRSHVDARFCDRRISCEIADPRRDHDPLSRNSTKMVAGPRTSVGVGKNVDVQDLRSHSARHDRVIRAAQVGRHGPVPLHEVDDPAPPRSGLVTPRTPRPGSP